MGECGDHPVSHLLGRDRRLAWLHEVGRSQTRHEHVMDGAIDQGGLRLTAERIPQQHRKAADDGERVRDSPPGDIGRGAVDRLIQRRPTTRRVRRAQRGRRQHAQTARQHRGEIRQQVAEQVARDDHVESPRRTHELHRAVVRVHVVERHVRVVARAERRHDLPPQQPALHHVRLLDAGHPPRAPARELERHPAPPARSRRWCRPRC